MIRQALLTWLVLGTTTITVSAADPVDYLRDIKPILMERCAACHGAIKQSARLRVDTTAAMVDKGVIVPKQPAESSLIERIAAEDDAERMPPEGLPLSPEQIALFKRWIAEGAPAPADEEPEADPSQHWAFQPPTRPEVPAGSGSPIDRFLQYERTRRGLPSAPAADPQVLIRRMTLDLTGLPPTVAETEQFLRDHAKNPDQAVERLADRLLASPQYGERWGRHFLDIWRYSDWWGLGAEVRNSQKHMWHWRDWVIESINQDLSYAEMIRLQLAADELHPTDAQRLRATGYLARQYFKFNRNSWMEQTVEHTAKAFLGLTWNCARCHDHKYDPISQEDYYRFRAFFEPYQIRTDLVAGETNFEKNGIPRVFDCNLEQPTYLFIRGDDKQPVKDQAIPPGLPEFLAPQELAIRPVELPAEAHSPQIRHDVYEAYVAAARAEGDAAVAAVTARWKAEIARVQGTPAEAKRAAQEAARAEKLAAVARAEAQLAKTRGARRIAPGIVLMKAQAAAQNPGEKFTPLRGALKTLESNIETEASRNKPFPQISTGRRSALAKWIADRGNPLTARVAVNHVWARHFGAPLVPTVFEFGRKGVPPTHPELLDWLAVEFMEKGWSLKHLHRLMVTSQAYRMSSSSAGVDASARQHDPENRYYWRMNTVRMDAPTIRDSLLAISGDLDRTMYGPAIPSAEHAKSLRRSVYFFQSHNEYDKFLSIFDDANVLECYRRTESIIPQQALALTNSKIAMTVGQKITEQLGDHPDAEYVNLAFARILGVPPTAGEHAACLEAMTEWRALASKQPLADQTRQARLGLVQALLNHNDFVTIR